MGPYEHANIFTTCYGSFRVKTTKFQKIGPGHLLDFTSIDLAEIHTIFKLVSITQFGVLVLGCSYWPSLQEGVRRSGSQYILYFYFICPSSRTTVTSTHVPWRMLSLRRENVFSHSFKKEC